MIDGLRAEAAVHNLLVDRRRAGEPRVKRVDARGADENLACAFVFLAKPAGLHHAGYNPAIIFVFLAVCTKPAATLVLPSSSGSPYTVGKEPESATAPPS